MIALSVFQYLVIVVWLVSFAVGVSVVYGMDGIGMLMELEQPEEWLRVSYNTFARSAWGFAVSWLIFACVNGYGGIVCIPIENNI